MKKRYAFLLKNWSIFISSLLYIVASTINAQAQTAPNIQWDKSFGGNDAEYLFDIVQTSDGGYIAGGDSGSGISGDKSQASIGGGDCWIVRLDGNGNKIWDKTFGGSGFDYVLSLQQTTDGGSIIGCRSISPISGDKSQPSKGSTDYWVLKLDINGNKLWDKTFGGSSHDEIQALQQTADGGYILGGYSESGISGDKSQTCRGFQDYWVIKIDALGNKQWDKTFGGNSIDELFCLQQTSDGGYILGGESQSGLSGDKSQVNSGTDFWIIKLDGNGNKIWDKTIGGNGYDRLESLQQTLDGGYILGGGSNSSISGDKTQTNHGAQDYWIVKLDANGNKIWDKTFGGNHYDNLIHVKQGPNNTYILGGTSRSPISSDKTEPSKGNLDYWIIKTDANGNKIWDKTIGSADGDNLLSMYSTIDGGYILGGDSYAGISGDKSQPSKGGIDFWIVKLAADVTGIKEPAPTFNLSIFPNPNQGKFTLQLSNLTAQKAEVTVFDLLGRVVLQQSLTVSNKQISEELTLPNAKGMYLLQVKIGEQLITRKIVVE